MSSDSPAHLIDQSVTRGAAYCYTVFLKNSDGSVTTVGTTGLVTVPNVGSVPPARVSAPAPTLATTSSHFDSALAKKVGVAHRRSARPLAAAAERTADVG